MFAALQLLLAAAPTTAALQMPKLPGRRQAIFAGLGIATAAAPLAASASKMPSHVEDLDLAVSKRDPSATSAALKVLGLPADQPSRLWEHGDASDNLTPSCSTTTNNFSAKVTCSVKKPNTDDDFVRFMWLSDVDSGSFISARELKSTDQPATTTKASKGRNVVSGVYFTRSGLWKSAPLYSGD